MAHRGVREFVPVYQDVAPPAEGESGRPGLSVSTTCLYGHRVEARACSAGAHRLAVQFTPLPSKLSTHWPLRHHTHRRASARHVAQVYAHAPSLSTSRGLHTSTTPPVSPAYKLHGRCVPAELGPLVNLPCSYQTDESHVSDM